MNEPARMSEQSDEALKITIEQPAENVTLLRVTGDLDLLTAPMLRERLRPLLDGNGTVLVDFSELGFLGSAGLAELAGAHDLAARNGSRVVLVASGRTVVRPLEVTGLHTLFKIYDSVEAALSGL